MLSSRCEQNARAGIFTHSESHFDSIGTSLGLFVAIRRVADDRILYFYNFIFGCWSEFRIHFPWVWGIFSRLCLSRGLRLSCISLALSWKFQLFCKNYNEINLSSWNMFEKYFLQDIHYNLYGILSESGQYNRLQRLNERRIYHKSGYEYKNFRNDFSNTLWKQRYNILKNFLSSVSIL